MSDATTDPEAVSTFVIYGKKSNGRVHPSFMFEAGTENKRFIEPQMVLIEHVRNVTWSVAKERYDALWKAYAEE